MVENNHILGGVMKKPSSTKPSKPKGTAIIKTKGTILPKPKPVKVKPVSKFGTIFVKSSYIHKSLKKQPKNPNLSTYYRGAEDKKIKDFAKFRGQLSPIIISDRSQCDEALGNIDCNGNNYCYICLSKLIPHFDVYTQCKVASKITAWNTTTLPNFTDTEKFYPQCEHVIACKTTSDDLNPWYMNFMMYSLHKKLLNFFSIPPEQNIRQFATTYTRPLHHLPSTDVKYLEYFLKIIIRMNYEWSHAICNNIKSNLEFANYISGNYLINNSNINHVLNMLFENDKNYFDNIEVKLGNHLINTTPPDPYKINLNSLSASTNKTPIKFEALNSINSRVQFILDELKYSRTLPLGGKGFNKFRHRSVSAPFASSLPRQGGGKGDEFIRKITSKNNNNNLNTNIDFNEIDIDFDKIIIPNDDDDFKKFIKNIHKTIFIEMLKKEANKDINEFERKITSVNIIIFTDNILDYLVRLISEFEIDDYFFQEVIHIFNSDINNIETNIINLYEFIKINKKVNRDTNVYEDIKDAENKKSYEDLIKLMIDILYKNPTKDKYIKEFEKTCIKELDPLNLESDYLKFLSFNNPDILKKYKEMLNNIYIKTSEETIKKHLFIINFFKKIYNNLFSPNDEKDFYNMCLIYFRLCIGYGHLYKKNLKYDKSKLADSTSLNVRLDKIKEIDDFLTKITLIPKLNEKDFKKLKEDHIYLSTIQESI